MYTLQIDDIRRLADSAVIFERGKTLQRIGAYRKIHDVPPSENNNHHIYEVDGNFGNYRTEVVLNGGINAQCNCPFPGNGCKHVVAILLELFDEQHNEDHDNKAQK